MEFIKSIENKIKDEIQEVAQELNHQLQQKLNHESYEIHDRAPPNNSYLTLPVNTVQQGGGRDQKGQQESQSK
ncbi:hypothetical protein QJS04_geneDACA007825 [Acorus gramineus]|uniref:Uncharacterized protein n=1 Tax=Acorus gramineus TaxID=55184 RepID=A0AAV9BCI5_ACOGR|nr:hypothetical protein QJS04_geneDACA007825 [Acorus gramineus]